MINFDTKILLSKLATEFMIKLSSFHLQLNLQSNLVSSFHLLIKFSKIEF